LGVLALAGLTVVGAVTGVLAPNLGLTPLGTEVTGGRVADDRVLDVEVAVVLGVDNRGRVDAEVRELDPPPVTGVTWATPGPTPQVLAAGDRTELRLVARVDDCVQVDARGAAGIGVAGRGLLPVTMGREHDLTTSGMTPGWFDDGDERDPSWIYDALERGCDPDRS
jgi:hypothetical protein